MIASTWIRIHLLYSTPKISPLCETSHADQSVSPRDAQKRRWISRSGLSFPCEHATAPVSSWQRVYMHHVAQISLVWFLACHMVSSVYNWTCLQVIDLGDSMDFTPLPGAASDELTCSVADIPTDRSNLVIKASRHRRISGIDARKRNSLSVWLLS